MAALTRVGKLKLILYIGCFIFDYFCLGTFDTIKTDIAAVIETLFCAGKETEERNEKESYQKCYAPKKSRCLCVS